MILEKSKMSEEDIKLNFITPALQNKGWSNKITMETEVKFTDGQIILGGNMTAREKPKRADYILYINKNNPIAIVEAKDNNKLVSYGLQQAKDYAQKLDIPFAYSSNGDAFAEFDFITGQERELPLDEFPTYEELINRYNKEKELNPQELSIIQQPYYTSQNTNTPRYYQRVAINRTLNAIAKGQNRLLLVMATGTGKTYTAFQIIYRLVKSGLKRKILYLADMNILVDQSIQQDFKPLEKTIHKINYLRDDPTSITAYEVYFSLYHQLTDTKNDLVEDDENEKTFTRLKELFKPDFFDFIVVDECHRGSAKQDSRWKKILEYFSSATQLGMTATPKETKYASNIGYFGEPVYSYSLKQGIDDGFLAPFRVVRVTTNIDDEWRPLKGQKDIFGNLIEDRIYNNTDYDYKIVIQDRIDEVAKEITNYLKQTNRMSKTIVFCADEAHAERMRVALTKQNADLCAQNPDYVVRITGSDKYGKEKLDYFISVSAKYPVIATTSQLLSTGVDCKMVKLIVLDQMISSMTKFKQIIGRGTRLREKEGKTHFTIMDFRGVTRLFADPDWDGPIEPVPPAPPKSLPSKPTIQPDLPELPEPTKNSKPIVDKEGCEVIITGKKVSVYDSNGKLLHTESIEDYTKTNILGNYANLEAFISEWNNESKKEAISNKFKERGIDLAKLKEDCKLSDVDDFDFICHLAYDKKPLTRKERANKVKKRDFLSKYSGEARAILEALLEKYINTGISELESISILSIDPLNKFGKPAKIVGYFGGKSEYLDAIKELETEIYKVA